MRTEWLMGKRFLVMMILVLLVCCGCSRIWPAAQEADAGYRTAPPVVYIYPKGEIGWDRKVGVLPFLVPGNVDQEQGMRIAALFKDVLLGEQVFRTVRQLVLPYGTLDEALDIGRQEGLDFVLAGRLTSVLEGGEIGGARVEVAVRLLSTATGDTVWYLEQAVDQKIDHLDERFVTRMKAIGSPQTIRLSGNAPPVPSMLARVAFDMAGVIAAGDPR